MIRAIIDSPWAMVWDEEEQANRWQAELFNDPVFGPYIKTCRNLTPVYPKSTEAGKTILSNEMDYIQCEVTLDDQSQLDAIDGDDRYQVYWTELELEDGEPAPAASDYRGKSEVPAPNAWGKYRSKLARRGVSNDWIKKYVDKRELMWGQHDLNVQAGYMGSDEVIGEEEEIELPTDPPAPPVDPPDEPGET